MFNFETYLCKKCGNKVEIKNHGGGELSCCSEVMSCVTYDLTEDNLNKSFQMEAISHVQNQIFANIVEREGDSELAKYYRDLSQSNIKNAFFIHENINHRENFSTKNILEHTLCKAMYENANLYPSFSKIANGNDYIDAEILFLGLGSIKGRELNKLKELEITRKNGSLLHKMLAKHQLNMDVKIGMNK
ncbi:hypothetical protein L0B53_03370 [Vibrio sp. SS-MA-C1-2]|uniref:hypothetical protein n=1 Tax=Vibrio sp. SS-MA-C1-2 TaxID=2908646 RepID=UPI001F23B9D1|nr:hypothetical protein [Vibrio sp. SS-MA-C1-2]UJF16994.1 hypothetical protein L0B53_03370 [Vibrio sp. SS-MA-C1-2]